MKREGKFIRGTAATVLVFGLTCLTGMAQFATNDFLISGFDPADGTNGWGQVWGSPPLDIEFDASKDAKNLANSGSLKVTVDFDAALYSGDNQLAMSGKFPLSNSFFLDASQYTNLVFDVLWDTTNSPSNGGTNFGTLLVSLGSVVGVYTVPTNAGWQHVVLPINPTLPQVEQANNVFFQMWAPSFTGTTTFWLDNVLLQAPTNAMTRLRPTLALKPTTPGLQLISTSTFDGAGARYNLFTANPGYSWVDAPSPTTYSVNIKTYPNFATYPYYQTQILLIPESSLASPWDATPDWTSSNLIFLSIQSEPDGSGVALLMYKTNAPGSWQNQIWGANVVGGIWSPNILGTWSLTFNNNTNVTLTAPSHETKGLVFPAGAIPSFRDPNGTYAYFGSQPNRDLNAGQSSILGEIQITGGVDGSANPSPDIDETFTNYYLDYSLWDHLTYLPVATADTPYWVQWTLPDGGADLMANQSLDSNGWYDAFYVVAPVYAGPFKQALVPYSLFGTNSSFFILSQ
jgi:hypothetical protein